MTKIAPELSSLSIINQLKIKSNSNEPLLYFNHKLKVQREWKEEKKMVLLTQQFLQDEVQQFRCKTFFFSHSKHSLMHFRPLTQKTFNCIF